MQDFVYDSGVRIFYGASQLPAVTAELAKLGKRLLAVSTGSFIANGHYAELERRLTAAGLQVFFMNGENGEDNRGRHCRPAGLTRSRSFHGLLVSQFKIIQHLRSCRYCAA